MVVIYFVKIFTLLKWLYCEIIIIRTSRHILCSCAKVFISVMFKLFKYAWVNNDSRYHITVAIWKKLLWVCTFYDCMNHLQNYITSIVGWNSVGTLVKKEGASLKNYSFLAVFHWKNDLTNMNQKCWVLARLLPLYRSDIYTRYI